MKHFLKSIILFAPFSIAVYTLLIVLWGEYAPDEYKKNLNYKIGSYGHMYSRVQNIKEIQHTDILFLGSSHAYRGFDPRIMKQYGFNTFNLGSSSQTPIQAEVLLTRYLGTINPKTIIYEVYPESFSIDGIESSTDIIANDTNDFASIKMAINQNHIKIYNTLLYGLYRDIFKKNTNFTENATKDDDTYISGGYVEKKLKYYTVKHFDKREWKFNEKQFQAFENILTATKERNIKIILVQAPVTKSKYSSYTNNNIFDDTIEKYGAYYNFNEIIELDETIYFYDARHLNQNGVKVFNIALLELLTNKNNAADTETNTGLEQFKAALNSNERLNH